ncbi:MAG: hypothetical protein ACRCZ2_13985 [Fusobacteriaceae bacterium]
MAKKQKREKGETPFFSTKTFTRRYKTKDSYRSYIQTYYFEDGKRISQKSLSHKLEIDEPTLEYLARYSDKDFDESIKRAVENSLELVLDLNDVEELLSEYIDLEDRNISELVLQVKKFLGRPNDMPFISSLEFEIDKKNKLVYFDFFTVFTRKENGLSYKVVRGKSEFAVYDSN